MKTLKKYLKVVLCFMAFAVASFAFAFSPISPAFATTATEFAQAMELTKMPTKVDAQKEDLHLPVISGAKIRVYEPTGAVHTYEGESDEYFTKIDDSNVKIEKEKLIGSSNAYRIVYVKDKFYSKEYKVYVSDASYTLKLVEENNSRVWIPSKIAKNADARVALPTRAEKNGVECTSDVTVEVRKDGHFVVDYTLGTSPAGNSYVVDGKFVPKDAGEYTISYSANKCDVVKYSFEVEEGYVAPSAEDITFETPKVSGIELGKKEIPVVSNYQAERPLKITDKKGNDVAYNLKSIEIVNAGNENIKATLGYNTYVFDMTTTAFGATAYRDMVGTYNFVFTVEDVYGHTLTKTVEVKNVTDSTSPKVKMAYNYTVDADQEVVGEVNTNVEADFKASVGYKELVLPAVYAEDYVSTNSDMKYVRFLTQTSTGKEFYVDNLVVRNYTIQHLEYVEETVNEKTVKYFKNKDDANDTTHYNGNYALVTKEGNVYTTSYGEANKDVKVQFAAYDDAGHYSADDLGLYCGEKGEYAIHYRAYRDVVNKTYGELTGKTIKVESSEKHAVGTTTPKVEVRTESSNVEKNSTIKVKTIAADENSEDVLKTSVYFKNFASKGLIDVAAIKTAANNALTAALADYYQDELWTNYGPCNILDSDAFKTAFAGYSAAKNNLTADGEYEIELGESSGYYAVVALTINNDSHLGIAVKTLKVVDTSDVDAPSATPAEWDNEQKVAQQSVVNMPDVAFSDGDDDLALSVAYYVNDPETETGCGGVLAPSDYHYVGNKISGVKINADLVGTYYVVYTATDDAGNSTTVYYTFEAIQAADPVLSVSASGEDLTKSGNTVTGKLTPNGLKVDFKVEMKSADGNYDYTENAGGDTTVLARDIKCEINANGVRVDDNGDYSYTLQSAGTVTFTFSGYVKYNIGEGVRCEAISKTFTVTAEVPTMAWENENKLTQLETVAEKGKSIELPKLVAKHGAYGTQTSIKVEYIYNGKTEDVTDYIDKTDPTTPTPVLSGYTFIPHKDDGRYVVTYTAKSDYGTTITATHTFKLGDTYKPTFVVTGDADLKKDISLANDGTIKYNVSWSTNSKSFKVTVDGKEYPLNVTIKDKNKSNVETDMAWTDLKVQLLKDGKVVSAVSGYNYEITSAGAYTLRLYITDNNANEGEYKINFNVVNAAEPSTKTDLALGIVLIVLSVVVLAGAIVFFIFAGRKGGKGKGKKNKSVEENSNAENNSEAKSGDVE